MSMMHRRQYSAFRSGLVPRFVALLALLGHLFVLGEPAACAAVSRIKIPACYCGHCAGDAPTFAACCCDHTSFVLQPVQQSVGASPDVVATSVSDASIGYPVSSILARPAAPAGHPDPQAVLRVFRV
jgi:hypothetical protein